MLSGLEQYLSMSASPLTQTFNDYYSKKETSSTDVSELSSQLLREKSTFKSQPQVTPNGLMMLLSGKQNSRKISKKARDSVRCLSDKESSEDFAMTSLTESEQVDSLRTILPDESIRSTLEQDEILALEKRIYSSTQGVSASHFLQKPARRELESELTIVGENRNPLALLESKSIKSVSARSLFLSFAPKSARNKKGAWTLKVTLKISPANLALIRERETSAEIAAPTFKVTLKIPVQTLRYIQKTLSPLFVRSSGNQKNNGASAFDMMMRTATKNTLPKLTEIQKLRGLRPPPIKRDQMHVVPEELSTIVSPLNINLPLHEPQIVSISYEEDIEEFMNTTWLHNYTSSDHIISSHRILDNSNAKELIALKAPSAFTDETHKRIYEDFILNKCISSTNLPWPQKFQPPNLDCLLVNKRSRKFLKNWINDSFLKLEKQSMRIPRNVRKREQLRRQKRKQGPMADFIVDDIELEGEETEEDIYSPILIILGEHGSCKTSAVHAAMKALKGYVHEINSGQQRSRKDLHVSLKEFCTTKIISKNSEDDQFQKGLVLFEDCDVLFEQDKTFWTVVQDIINYSRRPIVLTARESSVIPRSIWDMALEQNSICTLNVNDENAVFEYLWLCCFAHGCIVSQRLLSNLMNNSVTSTGFDVRKLLMACQLLCSGRQSVDGSFTEIDGPLVRKDSNPFSSDICFVALQLDALSVSDVLEENTPSAFRHECIPNELLDLYIIDQSHLIKQRVLPYELNVGFAISEFAKHSYTPMSYVKHDFNSIRCKILDFLSSRSKAIPKFLQDLYQIRAQTRSQSLGETSNEEPETQGLPDTSTCYSMAKHAFLTDLAPFVRDWALFQKSVVLLDSQRSEHFKGETLQEFLNWRLFHGDTENVLGTI